MSNCLRHHGLYSPWSSLGQNTGVGSYSLLQGMFPSPGDVPDPGIEPRSPTLWADSLPAEPPGKPKNTGVGSLSLLQGIFLTQELNWGLLHCRKILYQLSYQGSDAGDMGSIPGLETKIPHAVRPLCPPTATKELTCFNKDPAQPKLKINLKKRIKQSLKKENVFSKCPGSVHKKH